MCMCVCDIECVSRWYNFSASKHLSVMSKRTTKKGLNFGQNA